MSAMQLQLHFGHHWSQRQRCHHQSGFLSVQCSLKYWPSTRAVVNDFGALSPDFYGTVNARLFDPSFPLLGCIPSILQWEIWKYVQTLLSDAGDSAYVPTTIVDSITDEIIQPRAGTQDCGVIIDVLHLGVLSTQTQTVSGHQQVPS